MRRIGILTKMKSAFFGTAIVALLGFGFQSAALPVHAAVHAAVETAQFAASAKDSPRDSAADASAGRSAARTIEADCDLCALASHQAIHFDAIPVFAAAAAVELRSETPPADAPSARFALLPPARAPPVRA